MSTVEITTEIASEFRLLTKHINEQLDKIKDCRRTQKEFIEYSLDVAIQDNLELMKRMAELIERMFQI